MWRKNRARREVRQGLVEHVGHHADASAHQEAVQYCPCGRRHFARLQFFGFDAETTERTELRIAAKLQFVFCPAERALYAPDMSSLRLLVLRSIRHLPILFPAMIPPILPLVRE